MADQRNGLTARDSHIWTLRMALLFAIAIITGLIAVIWSKQNHFTIQIPPDLSKGALLKPGEFQPATSYLLAHHVWTELNTWRVKGSVDYPAKITTYDCFVTPSFKKWLEEHKDIKSKKNELAVTRSATVIDSFKDEYVKPMGADTFMVSLYLNIVESLDGYEVKNNHFFYPIRVVPDNRKCNVFGQALDGFYQEPQKFNMPGDK